MWVELHIAPAPLFLYFNIQGLDGQELGELTEPLQNLNDDNDKNSTVFKCSGKTLFDKKKFIFV